MPNMPSVSQSAAAEMPNHSAKLKPTISTMLKLLILTKKYKKNFQNQKNIKNNNYSTKIDETTNKKISLNSRIDDFIAECKTELLKQKNSEKTTKIIKRKFLIDLKKTQNPQNPKKLISEIYNRFNQA
ncbi:hypothetical protein BB561_004112 [Smittium simulii]|uniref:Uncharacterized protein n=1 Tax=Smittium simulii TaxID=133385 RepID=A0A2T9YI39_9FUNG|nr:hypothetical protein BB561_004112 [Smittium simulii]